MANIIHSSDHIRARYIEFIEKLATCKHILEEAYRTEVNGVKEERTWLEIWEEVGQIITDAKKPLSLVDSAIDATFIAGFDFKYVMQFPIGRTSFLQLANNVGNTWTHVTALYGEPFGHILRGDIIYAYLNSGSDAKRYTVGDIANDAAPGDPTASDFWMSPGMPVTVNPATALDTSNLELMEAL